MNLINGKLIDNILFAADTLRNDTIAALGQYRNDIEREKRLAQRYKAEEEYLAGQRNKLSAIARAAIEKAERVFSGAVQEYADEMEMELRRHIAVPVNNQLRERLLMLTEFGISPTRTEIDALLELNRGNQIGLAAIQKTLERTKSPFPLKYHTTEDFENDLKMIRDLPRNLKYIPLEYLHEGIEIYEGRRGDYQYEGGGTVGNQFDWDSVSLIQNAQAFESKIEKIQGLKDIWAADCSYTQADQFAEDIGAKPVKSGVTVTESEENNAGMRFVKQMGADAARARKALEELKNSML